MHIEKSEFDEVREPAPKSRASGRRHARVPLVLSGRYMLADGSEFPCETTDVSPVGLGIRGFRCGPVGSKVVAYIDGLGRVDGRVVRRSPGWFALSLADYAGKEGRL